MFIFYLVCLFLLSKKSWVIVITLVSASAQNFNLSSYLKKRSTFYVKLGTHVPRNNTHVYTKSHSSGINNTPFSTLNKIDERWRSLRDARVIVYTNPRHLQNDWLNNLLTLKLLIRLQRNRHIPDSLFP